MNIRNQFTRRFIAFLSICIVGLFLGGAMSPKVFAQAPEIFLATHPASGTRNQPNPNQTQVEAYACVSDASGNTYVAGSSSGITVWGTNSVTSFGGAGYDDMVLIKYSPTGDVLWVRKAAGSYKEEGRALALDGSGGVYLAGTTTSDILPLSANVSVFNEANTVAFFLARYDGSGNLLWANRGGSWMLTPFIAGSSANVWPNSLAVDSGGNPVVAGRFVGNPMFGGTIHSNLFTHLTYTNGVVLTNRFQTASTSSRTEDLFLAKFNAAGNLLWATNHGSTNVESVSGIALDSLDNIYAAGAFNKSTTLGAANFTNSAYAPFLAKFNANGVPIWASNLSEPTNNNGGRAWSVVVDLEDRPTVSFTTPTSPFRLGADSFTNQIFSQFGVVASGFAQFETNGTVRWMKRAPFNVNGTVNGVPNSFGLTLTRDGADSLFARSVSFLATNGTTFGTAGIHILKMTSNGEPLWTNSVTPLAISFIDRTATDPFSLPAISLDGSGRISVVATISGDPTATGFIGWTNITTAFTNGFGYNQLLYRMESNYVAVAPQFVQQPTNLVFQPPQGFTNSTLARAWPVATYRWYMLSNSVVARLVTNSTLTVAKPTTLAHITSYYCVASNTVQQTTSTVFTAQARLALYPLTNYSPIVLLGGSTAFSINATGTTAFSYQWRKNGTNLPGANSASLVVNYPDATSGTNRYDVISCNDYGCLTSTPPATVTVKPFGTQDPTFPPGSVGRQVLVEPMGTLLVGGRNLIRYTATGTVVTNGFYDPSPPSPGQVGFFYPANIVGGGPNIGFHRDPDGKIVVGGHFTRLNTNGTAGPALNRMVRFNADGTIDPGFDAGTGPALSQTFDLDNSYSTLVRVIARQADGKYLVGGSFKNFNGVARTNLVRLNTDGSVDLAFQGPTFDTSTSPSSQPSVRAILIRPGGGLAVAHEYRDVGGTTFRPCVVGLTENGAMDTAFNANLPVDGSLVNWGSYATGRALALQKDGKILLAGQFSFQQSGFGYSRVVRFNGDGSLDTTFKQTNYISGAVNAVALQSDGTILFGGDNQPIRRVDANGANDTTFVSEVLFNSTQLEAIAVDGDKIYVTGAFGLYRLLGALPTTVVPEPTFSTGTAVRLPDGMFTFTTCSQAGQTIVIEASTNLVDWIPVGTNAVAGDCIEFKDTQAPLIPNRFYRLVVQ
jgi:uncharacterized delta-60 repeat protein